MKREAVIEVANLRIEREATILSRIDWRVEQGQNWVMLGANGSGKTSLLRALTGYLPPTGGSIEMLGHTYGRSDWRALRTRVGLVSSALEQMMPEDEPARATVISGRYAMVGLWGSTTPADRTRANAILRQVEALEVAQRPWGQLSQGERQRVLIGRALMAAPRLLILDEPCAGLDPVARERFLGFLDRLAAGRRAPTLLLVTHHVEEITPAFSHVLLLKAGAVLAAGPREAVLTSRMLAQAFDAPLNLRRNGARYTLTIGGSRAGAL